MRPDPCQKTGYPRFNSATEAWKAGSKLIRHPLNTTVFINKCEHCKQYHYIIKTRDDV